MNLISEKFFKKIHFWGTITIFVALIFNFLIPLYLTFILKYIPKIEIVISGVVAIIGFVGIVWIVEPISYYSTLGSAGTYMSFLSGNIGNMRMPVITATQDALKLNPGSEKAEIAGIYALVSSIFTNLFILVVVMIAGQYIVNTMPQKILDSFKFALPGILGAMLVMMGSKIKKKYILKLIILASISLLFIKFSPQILPQKIATAMIVGNSGIVSIFAILYAIISAKIDYKKE
ncbi:hypothetical protein [Oceanivirga salmonicida]|uniref:hypothetical protein n=1 Tax=Oceanivirga salmonicida TaxID=1769291 RepID=UPI0008331306|nr:hypothetical protein [Oceanivirga salmonicida]